MEGNRAALAAALALAFVVSCGGSATPTSSTSSASSGAGTAAAQSTTQPSAAASQGGGAGPKLLDLLTASKATQYKISYKITASGAGADAFSGQQTWYFAPPRARYDFSSSFGGQQTTISFFILSDGSYYCFAAGGQTQCLSVGGIASPLDQNAAALANRDLVDHPDQWGGTFKEMRTIAGAQAYCYDVKSLAAANAGLTAGTFCYSKEGVPLLSQFSMQGASWAMEATTFSTTVTDADFTLPAKPLSR